MTNLMKTSTPTPKKNPQIKGRALNSFNTVLNINRIICLQPYIGKVNTNHSAE